MWPPLCIQERQRLRERTDEQAARDLALRRIRDQERRELQNQANAIARESATAARADRRVRAKRHLLKRSK